MEFYSQWDYYIASDEFQVYFPEGDYTIADLVDWYKTIPTHPKKISYYGDNIELLKRHFEKFVSFSDVHSKLTNDHHSNSILKVFCLAIYNLEGDLLGFAAQEYRNGFPADKKISYFRELKN